jgi:hypothetical protein
MPDRKWKLQQTVRKPDTKNKKNPVNEEIQHIVLHY